MILTPFQLIQWRLWGRGRGVSNSRDETLIHVEFLFFTLDYLFITHSVTTEGTTEEATVEAAAAADTMTAGKFSDGNS